MWYYSEKDSLSEKEQNELMVRLIQEARQRITPTLKRVLLLPPDITRYHSGAGWLTNRIYHLLGPDCHVDIIPTLGQHVPHTPEENAWMFGDIPNERILTHDWLRSCALLGEIDGDFVKLATQGLAEWPV